MARDQSLTQHIRDSCKGRSRCDDAPPWQSSVRDTIRSRVIEEVNPRYIKVMGRTKGYSLAHRSHHGTKAPRWQLRLVLGSPWPRAITETKPSTRSRDRAGIGQQCTRVTDDSQEWSLAHRTGLFSGLVGKWYCYGNIPVTVIVTVIW